MQQSLDGVVRRGADGDSNAGGLDPCVPTALEPLRDRREELVDHDQTACPIAQQLAATARRNQALNRMEADAEGKR
jgi:hypothetical protein